MAQNITPMITITYDWQDPITLIQVPYTHKENSLKEALEFIKALFHSALVSNHQYSHLTISKHS